MEKIQHADYGSNSLRLLAASKIPKNKKTFNCREKSVLTNLAGEFIEEKRALDAQKMNQRDLYLDTYDKYNQFVMRETWNVDLNNLRAQLSDAAIDINMGYDNIPPDISENCHWFAFLEYVKFNVMLTSAELTCMSTIHKLIIMCKGMLSLLPEEPNTIRPHAYNDMYEAYKRYFDITKRIVSDHDTTFSYEECKKRQKEYAIYLDEYDRKLAIYKKRAEILDSAIDMCLGNMYDPLEDKSLDEILDF